MSTSQPVFPHHAFSTWAQHSRWLMIVTGAVVLVVGLGATLALTSSLGTVMRDPARVDSLTIVALVVSTPLLIASLCSWALWSHRIAIAWGTQPSYGRVGIGTYGHPYEVRFKRHLMRQSLAGKGTVRLDGDALHLEGTTAPPILVQLAIALTLTLVILFALNTGWGLPLALMVTPFVGRKKVVRYIAYKNLSALTVFGEGMSFASTELDQGPVELYVARSDRERLQHELRERMAI